LDYTGQIDKDVGHLDLTDSWFREVSGSSLLLVTKIVTISAYKNTEYYAKQLITMKTYVYI